MASARQSAANRANARKSTGPRSADGKERASANSFVHGLSVSVLADPQLSKEVTSLARSIAGRDPTLLGAASAIAEAQVDLRRVRRLRTELLTCALSNPNYVSDSELEEVFLLLDRVRRENTFGRIRRQREDRLNSYFSTPTPGRHLDGQFRDDLTREWSRTRQYYDRMNKFMIDHEVEGAVEHEVRILRGLVKELSRLDRYERRALSRRKFAIREFDAQAIFRARNCA